ncbi:MAG: DNA primase [Desulfurococcales archaeon]|nr:DNA primase [Desulfurococcales archaeon]
MKYLIRAKAEIDGIVDKSDIVGAIFGQTEGLFSPDFDLRELQDKGRIGRIVVDIRQQGSKTIAEILVPSNLDKAETALVAAMIEFVDKVGPYSARIKVVDIIDVRYEKIRKITERAKEILKKWLREKTIDVKEIINEIETSIKAGELIYYGPERLPAGPEVDSSDTVIIVEGRADVINMLKYGYRNVIALEGARGKIPETIVNLSKRKKTIVFLDGDHAGDLILKELLRVAKVDYIARAPPGREVEELTGKEIAKALKNAVPAKIYLQQLAKEAHEAKVEERKARAEAKKESAVVSEVSVAETIQVPTNIVEDIKSIRGTLEAFIYNDKWELLDKVPVRDLVDYLLTTNKNGIYAIIMDGIITQRVVDAASVKGVKLIIGARVGVISKRPTELTMLTMDDVLH